MKTVWTITTNAVSGTPELFGVYENAGAAAIAFEHLTNCSDPDDEYRIKHAVVEEYADVLESKTECDKQRAEAMADVSN